MFHFSKLSSFSDAFEACCCKMHGWKNCLLLAWYWALRCWDQRYFSIASPCALPFHCTLLYMHINLSLVGSIFIYIHVVKEKKVSSSYAYVHYKLYMYIQNSSTITYRFQIQILMISPLDRIWGYLLIKIYIEEKLNYILLIGSRSRFLIQLEIEVGTE